MIYLSNEALADLVRDLCAAPAEQQRKGLAGTKILSSRARLKRDAAPAADAEATIRTQLGGDIIGRIVPFVISTGDRAEDGHTIDPEGWDVADYERAPHVFWSHEYSGWRASPSRAAARIGASVVAKSPDALTAMLGCYTRDFSMCLDEGFSYAIGEIAARQGHRASVGFDVVEAAVAPEDVRRTIPWALDISVARLNEWSLVNFGADSNAITEGRNAGIDVAPIARALERFLDDVAGATGASREALTRMWAAAADPARARVVAPAAAPAVFDADAFRAAVADGLKSALA